MTDAIIAAALLALAAVAAGCFLLVRRAQRERQRLQANIFALERMTESIKQADRRRVEKAVNEHRRLVQKLLVAIDDDVPAKPLPAEARQADRQRAQTPADADRGLVEKLLMALDDAPPRSQPAGMRRD